MARRRGAAGGRIDLGEDPLRGRLARGSCVLFTSIAGFFGVAAPDELDLPAIVWTFAALASSSALLPITAEEEPVRTASASWKRLPLATTESVHATSARKYATGRQSTAPDEATTMVRERPRR